MFILLFFYVVAFLGITGSSDDKIKPGTVAVDGQFPYQVSLRIKNVHYCSGSIINTKIIITVAHCLMDEHFQYRFDLYVVTGTNKLQTGGQTQQIRKLTVHDLYGRNKNQHDVGLIELHKEITFDANIKAIELTSDYTRPGPSVVSGWGLTGPTDTTRENDLKHAILDILPYSDCTKHVGKSHDSTMCATAFNTKICVDCGGPITVNEKLVGLIIYGIHNCMPNSVNLAVDLYHVNDWIDNNIRESVYLYI